MKATQNLIFTNIQNQSDQRVPRVFILSWVPQIVKAIQKADQEKLWPIKACELTLVFMNSGNAKKLNQKFRRKNYATDILSFESEDPESLGELVICSDVLQRQAKEHKHSFQLELGYMLIHGILHLLGYDHEHGGRNARKMYALQDSIFEKLSKPVRPKKKRPKAEL